jgi:hypothetical protein
MSKHFFILLALAGAAGAAGACNRGTDTTAQRQLAGRVLKGALAYPNSALIGVAAGEDAAELRFTSPDAPKDVAAWFREVLPMNKWELEHDAVNRDGSIVIYAKQGERPLWITLSPHQGGPGTSYTMIGAVVEGDSVRVR